MAIENKQFAKWVPPQIVLLISIVVFWAGAGFALLVCGHYAHEPLGPTSGFAAGKAITGQVEGLEAEVKKNPANVKAWAQLGSLYFDANRYKKAIFAYRRALQRDPQDADLWTDLGIIYRIEGQAEKAITSFDRAIAVAPEDENARLYKGIVLADDLNDRAGAIREWTAVLAINPLALAWENQSVLELLQQYQAKEPSGAK